MKTSYNPEFDPTRTTPTPKDRLQSFVGWMLSIAGMGILGHTVGGRAAFGVWLVMVGGFVYTAAEQKSARRRQSSIEELKRRAREHGIILDEEEPQ